MEANTCGAWIIHNTKKIQAEPAPNSFDETLTAGKCGLLLSLITESDATSTLSAEKVKLLAKASGINHLEYPTLIDKLKANHLIDQSSGGSITALGLTTSTVLRHTNNIFQQSNPSSFERASIEIANCVSSQPQPESFIKEYISDTFSLSTKQIIEVIHESESFGLFDYEQIDDKSDRLIFNGNLFRKDSLRKTQLVLSSMNSNESGLLAELDQMLATQGCVTLEDAKKIAGEKLLEKLQSIGMYDFLEVSNPSHNKVFITKPAAFSKFGNPFEEDALDLAKAFVASLSYGMTFSAHSRGKISQLKWLMQKMINGQSVGPATAIGHDYKVLEINRVVEITPSINYPSRFNMRLLKKDIGVLALQVLESGDSASEEAVLFSSDVSHFTGPESKRVQTRKRQDRQKSNMDIVELLRTLK